MWALTDFTKANGATRVLPRTHIRPFEEGKVPSEEETVYAEMPKGSVLIYTGSVLHSGGANVSHEWRLGIHLSFALGWLRQQENQVGCKSDETVVSFELLLIGRCLKVPLGSPACREDARSRDPGIDRVCNAEIRVRVLWRSDDGRRRSCR